MPINRLFTAATLIALGACGVSKQSAADHLAPIDLPSDYPFTATVHAQFNEPWAMTFLPDGRALITEKPGNLYIVAVEKGSKIPVSGVPTVAYKNQGGLGDVVLHPDYADNGWVYISYVRGGRNNARGAVVIRAKVNETDAGASLSDIEEIWRQVPFTTGAGHYGHRIAFKDGYLFISSGERQKFTPSQDMTANLGKVVRLFPDGSIPEDNPFADKGGVTAQIWSLGHRNPLGLAFDANGQLWNTEMGPRHGDELNKVEPGNNYGYPLVSNGNHYDGRRIPDHDTRPDLDAPATYWVPAISPSSLMFYNGERFPDWQGSALIGGLSGKALVVVDFDGDTAAESARYPMERVREIEQGPEGAVWLLEDGEEGRLLKLTPRG
ncbi:MAG: PQQ-dependent sugar dehydrogenase [Pseudomonadota bacterium]